MTEVAKAFKLSVGPFHFKLSLVFIERPIMKMELPGSMKAA